MHPHLRRLPLLVALLLSASPIYSQNAQPAATPSVVIAADGTVTVTRVVPVPKTISLAAQEELKNSKAASGSQATFQQRREAMEKWATEMGAEALKLYPANTKTDTIAGVAVRVITPLAIAPENASKVLINLHGGGFRFDASRFLAQSRPARVERGEQIYCCFFFKASRRVE